MGKRGHTFSGQISLSSRRSRFSCHIYQEQMDIFDRVTILHRLRLGPMKKISRLQEKPILTCELTRGRMPAPSDGSIECDQSHQTCGKLYVRSIEFRLGQESARVRGKFRPQLLEIRQASKDRIKDVKVFLASSMVENFFNKNVKKVSQKGRKSFTKVSQTRHKNQKSVTKRFTGSSGVSRAVLKIHHKSVTREILCPKVSFYNGVFVVYTV